MLGRTDPTTALAAGTVTSLSPLLGDYAIIMLGAVAGALCALSNLELRGWKWFWYFFRAVVTSTMTASFAAIYIGNLINHPVQVLLMPVSFIIAYMADQWPKLKDYLVERFTRQKT